MARRTPSCPLPQDRTSLRPSGVDVGEVQRMTVVSGGTAAGSETRSTSVKPVGERPPFLCPAPGRALGQFAEVEIVAFKDADPSAEL